jgi:hypothetical protein
MVDTLQYPSEAVRKKLVIAGIPESEHGMSSLAAKMPDLELRALNGISVDMLAELLLYLVAKGIVVLPVAGDKALLDLPWGSHVCQFYERKDDLVKMLVPYFKQGLERNEACAWMVDDLTVEEARKALEAAVPDLKRFMDAGQMQIRHYTELYTNADGTVKPADQLSEDFVGMGSTVKANGFEGLRASGSVSWVKDAESMSRFMDYEAQVNLAIQNSNMMAVCTYPAEAAATCQCGDLIHNHGKIFVKRGEWVHDKSKDAKKIEEVFASLAIKSHAANVAQMNRIAASIAHEVKQPLAAIVTNANAALRWLSRDNPDIAEARTALTEIVNDGLRADDVIKGIRAMFKKDTAEHRSVNINGLIASVLTTLRIDLEKNGVMVQAQLSDRLPDVIASSVQLQQVILNLMTNAIDAMHSVQPRVLLVKSELNEPDGVHVSIEDSGAGIDPSNLDRVFKPLFTTKASGMGLGLSICHSIIEGHHGRIWATPAIGHSGSIFQFVVPANAPPKRLAFH